MKDFYVKKLIKIADSSAQAAKKCPVFKVKLLAGQIIIQDKGEENGNMTKHQRKREGVERRTVRYFMA